MATNFIRDGKKMEMPTANGAESGDAYVVGGYLPCVLLTDAGADPYKATVQTEGVFDLSCIAHDGSGASAIAVGDMLYWTDKDTPLDKDSDEDPFGIALEAVGSGLTATINVMLVPKAVMPASVGTADIEAKAVTGAKLADAVQDSLITFGIAAADQADGTADVTIQAKDSEGNELAKNVLIRAWTSATTMGVPAASTDLTVAATAYIITEHLENADIDIITDATGEAVLTITDTAGTYYLMIESQGVVTSTAVTITDSAT